jgi:hypothetical protein
LNSRLLQRRGHQRRFAVSAKNDTVLALACTDGRSRDRSARTDADPAALRSAAQGRDDDTAGSSPTWKLENAAHRGARSAYSAQSDRRKYKITCVYLQKGCIGSE